MRSTRFSDERFGFSPTPLHTPHRSSSRVNLENPKYSASGKGNGAILRLNCIAPVPFLRPEESCARFRDFAVSHARAIS
jgi:hypothetical protein